jgi:hypothetical protein
MTKKDKPMNYSSSFVLSVAGLMVACSGGGGDGGSVSPMATLGIDSSNQGVVAQEAVSTAFLPLFGAQTLTGAKTADESVLFAYARAQMGKLPAYIASASENVVLTGAVISRTLPCSSGGTLALQVTDIDNNGDLSTGDSVTLSGNNCMEPEGTINGNLGFVVDSLTGGSFGSSSYSARMTMAFAGFSIASSQFTGDIAGGLTMSISVNGVNTESGTLSTPSLSVSGTYAGVKRSRNLTNYSATIGRVPSSTYSYLTSYTASGTLTSSALASQVISFSTTTPLVSRSNDQYPSGGVLEITGGGNSRLRMTALSNTQVKQELDANGDGTYESSSTVNWDTLF